MRSFTSLLTSSVCFSFIIILCTKLFNINLLLGISAIIITVSTIIAGTFINYKKNEKEKNNKVKKYVMLLVYFLLTCVMALFYGFWEILTNPDTRQFINTPKEIFIILIIFIAPISLLAILYIIDIKADINKINEVTPINKKRYFKFYLGRAKRTLCKLSIEFIKFSALVTIWISITISIVYCYFML